MSKGDQFDIHNFYLLLNDERKKLIGALSSTNREYVINDVVIQCVSSVSISIPRNLYPLKCPLIDYLLNFVIFMIGFALLCEHYLYFALINNIVLIYAFHNDTEKFGCFYYYFQQHFLTN